MKQLGVTSTAHGGGKWRGVIGDKRRERTCDFGRYYNERYKRLDEGWFFHAGDWSGRSVAKPCLTVQSCLANWHKVFDIR